MRWRGRILVYVISLFVVLCQAAVLAIAILMFTSCKSSKSITTSDYERKEEANKSQAFDLLSLSKLNIDSWYKSITSGVINFRIYDTSRVDSLGNHPVLMDGNAIIDNTQESGRNEQKTDSTKIEATSVEENTTNEVKSDMTTIEKDATPVLKQSKSLVIWICILILLLIAWLVYKKRTK